MKLGMLTCAREAVRLAAQTLIGIGRREDAERFASADIADPVTALRLASIARRHAAASASRVDSDRESAEAICDVLTGAETRLRALAWRHFVENGAAA